MDSILVREYRGGMEECVHRGHICIVDERGQVHRFAGDPEHHVFTRSAAKPIQAIPGIRGGINDAFGLSDEEIAVMTASHQAEEGHIKVLDHLLQKLSLHEEELVCAPSLPMDEFTKEVLLSTGGQRRRIYHNCSGKHLGVLAYCKHGGYSLDNYSSLDHPVQVEILNTLSQLAGYPVEKIEKARDNCGFPVFALPMTALSITYLKLACPELISDPATANAVKIITAAMNKHPKMVGGSGKVDSVLLEDSNIVAKGGFKGIFAFGLRKERLGITLKVTDGSEDEWGMIVLEVLKQLDYGDKQTLNRLQREFPNEISNETGFEVGCKETVFKLDRMN